MSSSLLLDATTWDLTVDASNNIAVAADPYATAQDVACAIRTVLAEVWYNTTLGIDYFGLVFGKTPSLALLKAAIVTQALTVTNVVSAQCFITNFTNRVVTGQVQFTTSSGQTFGVLITQYVDPESLIEIG
jgi:hypothetical protein